MSLFDFQMSLQEVNKKFHLFYCLLWSKGNTFSLGRYSYTLTFPDDNVDIFAVSLLILYCSFPSLIFLSIVMITFYILQRRLHLKHKELSDARLLSVTKKEHVFAVHLYKVIWSWKSISDEWLIEICFNSLLFDIFLIK